MKKAATLIVLILVASTAYGAWPPNYYSLTPAQQTEVLMSEGYTGYDLDEIGKGTTLPILHSLLSKYASTDEKKAGTIVRMLSYFHDETSIDPLMQAWEANKKLEENIIYALTSIYSRNNYTEKAYRAMIKLIKTPRYEADETNSLNRTLYFWLVKMADKSKVPYLIEFLKDEDPPASYYELIDKMAEIGDPPIVVPIIAEFLKDSDKGMRSAAAETLGKLGSSLAIPQLKDAVKIEKELGVKMNMSAQLVKLGTFLYLEKILEALESPKWSNFSDIKSGAVFWLKEVTGQDFGEDAVAWRKWFEDEKARRGLK